MDWEQCRPIWERDGSLRDLYVRNTTLNDWERLLAFLDGGKYELTCSVDGIQAPLPKQSCAAMIRIVEKSGSSLEIPERTKPRSGEPNQPGSG